MMTRAECNIIYCTDGQCIRRLYKVFYFDCYGDHRDLHVLKHSFPTRRSSDLLNASMVVDGWAMAYREYAPDYIPQEEVASAAKMGIWAGQFVAPWDWRRGERVTAEVLRQEGGCIIKGNISSDGER